MSKVYSLQEALKQYNKSDIIAFPTDTVFGVGAHLFNEEAILKIYQMKHRPKDKPIAVLCANKNQILQVAKEIPEKMEQLIDHFLPGALTIILPKRKEVPDYITSGLDTIGIRIPKCDTALKLLEQIGPLATTSANLSGSENLSTGQEVLDTLGDDVDIIIDGNTHSTLASTVVTIVNGEVKILREGNITKEMIEKVLYKC